MRAFAASILPLRKALSTTIVAWLGWIGAAGAAGQFAGEASGPLDLEAWSFRKPVGVETAGVQELELDLEVLAHVRPDHADLRLIQGDRQVPYILERGSMARALKPIVRRADDPERPRHSRWSIQLPASDLPITSLVCGSSTPLFRRELDLYELSADPRGRRVRRQLGRATWVRTPERSTDAFTLELERTPRTDTLYLETDNTDNPPLQLSGFELGYPAVRLWFPSELGTELLLYYGNEHAGAPQYDLRLMAAQIRASEKASVYLGSAEPMRETAKAGRRLLTGLGGVLFWGVLLVVVVGLLFVMTRLVPKPPASDPADR